MGEPKLKPKPESYEPGSLVPNNPANRQAISMDRKGGKKNSKGIGNWPAKLKAPSWLSRTELSPI